MSITATNISHPVRPVVPRKPHHIGVPAMDAQHDHWLALAHEFRQVCALGLDKPDIQQVARRIYKQIEDHARHHFECEESLMLAQGYPNLAEHQVIHANLLATVIKIRDDLEFASQSASLRAQFLKDIWLFEHIASHDKDYAMFIRKLKETKPELAEICLDF